MKCVFKNNNKYLSNLINKIQFKLLLFISILFLFGQQSVYAKTYYVSSTSGDDVYNDGTSTTTPFRTIKKGLSKAWTAGDIVYVMTGTYIEMVYISQSNITLSAYPGHFPIINGSNWLPNKHSGSLLGVGGNYNTVSGFEVKNSNIYGTYDNGYGIAVLGHHNLIKKMNVHHVWAQGVIIHGDYNTVEDSKVWQAAYSNSLNPGSLGSWPSGMSAARNNNALALKPGITSYATFRRNIVYNNWGEGLSCFEADHCTVEDNISYDNWTVNFYLSDTTNSLVQRNIIYCSSNPAIPTRNNKRTGISLADEKSAVPRSAYNKIINNFIYNADFNAFAWSGVSGAGLNNVLIANNTIVDGSLKTGFGGSSNIINSSSQIRNNIILGSNSAVPSKVGITFSNNNWMVTPSAAESSSNVIGDPKISRVGTTTKGTLTPAYFKILADSPIRSKGVPLSIVTKDFFNFTRDSYYPDIGGHEFH